MLNPLKKLNITAVGRMITIPALLLSTLMGTVAVSTVGNRALASPAETSFAGIWVKSGGGAWQARSGLTSAQYQSLFNQLVGQGYRLTDVSGYNLNGEARYAAIFEQSSGPAWQARHGLTSAQYQATFNQLVGQGYRPVRVNGYEINGEDRYAVIFHKSNGSAWQARHGMTSMQYQTTFNQLVSQGYRLTDVSGYSVNGQARYAAIFEQSSSPAWQARHGLTSAQYQATFDQLTSQGYRLVRVSGYNVNGQDRYAGIWQQGGGSAWQARHGTNPGQFQAIFDQLTNQGYRLIDISGY
jgi:predicted cobalt transporter CbtA